MCNGICVQVQTETLPCLVSKSETKLCTLLFWSMLLDAKLNSQMLGTFFFFCICNTAGWTADMWQGRCTSLVHFISPFYLLLSLCLSMALCLAHSENRKQTRVPFLGPGAPVVLWESIGALVLLLHPGYVNHQEMTPMNDDSTYFNCITGPFRQGKQWWCVSVTMYRGGLCWLIHFLFIEIVPLVTVSISGKILL